MKFPVLWLSFVRVRAGTGKVICLAWDLVSRSHITLHLFASVAEKKIPKIGEHQIKIDGVRCELGLYCYTRLLTHSGGHLGILRNT